MPSARVRQSPAAWRLREGYVNSHTISSTAAVGIVHAYRFGEAMAMFRGSGVEWVAVNGINTPEAMKLVDLGAAEEAGRDLCLRPADMFESVELRDRFNGLSRMERLHIVELMTKPTGFTLVAGRGDSLARLGGHVGGNAVPADALPDPDPRIFRV